MSLQIEEVKSTAQISNRKVIKQKYKLQRSERIHLPDSFTTGQKSVKPLKIPIKPRNPSTRLRHPKSPSQPPKSFGHRKFFTGSLRDCSRLGKKNYAEYKQRKEKITNRFFSVNDAYTPQVKTYYKVAADKS